MVREKKSEKALASDNGKKRLETLKLINIENTALSLIQIFIVIGFVL